MLQHDSKALSLHTQSIRFQIFKYSKLGIRLVHFPLSETIRGYKQIASGEFWCLKLFYGDLLILKKAEKLSSLKLKKINSHRCRDISIRKKPKFEAIPKIELLCSHLIQKKQSDLTNSSKHQRLLPCITLTIEAFIEDSRQLVYEKKLTQGL